MTKREMQIVVETARNVICGNSPTERTHSQLALFVVDLTTSLYGDGRHPRSADVQTEYQQFSGVTADTMQASRQKLAK